MDKLNRLQALTGDADVFGEELSFQPFMFPTSKPEHLYEGTDSDDDEVVISRGRITSGTANKELKPSVIQSGLSMRP
jgi:hypothetical protein